MEKVEKVIVTVSSTNMVTWTINCSDCCASETGFSVLLHRQDAASLIISVQTSETAAATF